MQRKGTSESRADINHLNRAKWKIFNLNVLISHFHSFHSYEHDEILLQVMNFHVIIMRNENGNEEKGKEGKLHRKWSR